MCNKDKQKECLPRPEKYYVVIIAFRKKTK